MDTMINEDGLTFKDVEVYFFKKICETEQKMTREFLEGYDRYLMGRRDRAAYRHKGYRKPSIKKVYGEVEFTDCSFRRLLLTYAAIHTVPIWPSRE